MSRSSTQGDTAGQDPAARLAAHLATLPRIRRRDTGDGSVWRVDGRLVARIAADGRWIIRCDRERRDDLLARHPRVFGVRPRLEAHDKIEAYPEEAGDLTVIQDVLDAAWRRQKKH